MLSINPVNSLVLIDGATNKLVAYEPIKSDSAIYCADLNSRLIFILHQSAENLLTLSTYKILNLKEAFNEYFLNSPKVKLKPAIKLVL